MAVLWFVKRARSSSSTLPAGVYFYRLQADGIDETRRVVRMQ